MITGPSAPQAQICINKSRLKIYNKEKTPTYYLEKGSEFQIELFNPTSYTILAKIQLNGKQISQGGLVLRPGERVFLERYLDVAKKFLFDTYEVANTAEVKKAIEDNGDFKVEFYKERQSYPYVTLMNTTTIIPNSFPWNNNPIYPTLNGGTGQYYDSGVKYFNTNSNITLDSNSTSTSIGSSGSYFDTSMSTYNCNNASLTSGSYSSNSMEQTKSLDPLRSFAKKKERKSIETGRVEAGSSSTQQIQTVEKSFELWAFHSIEYKLLPLSQKVNTIEDVFIKRYCHNCGAKQKPEFKFCPSCGAKA